MAPPRALAPPKLTVPPGFIHKPDGYGKGFDVIECRGDWPGAVTIDWKARRLRYGMTTAGRHEPTPSRAGRGWQQALVDDAVKLLRAIYGENT